LQLRLQVAQHTMTGGPWWAPILSEMINARPGQVIDLGRIKLDNPMPIFVQVVDSAGQTVHGVGVRHIGAEGWYTGQQAVTDDQGFARFAVPPYYHGQFRVGYHRPDGSPVYESVDYQTNGIEDANNVYTLQLSDEMKKRLFE